MKQKHERLWVAIEFLRGGQSVLLRGTMPTDDYEAILSGSYLEPFVTLDNLHWLECIWNESEQRRVDKFTVYGRDIEWRMHTGTMHVKADSIWSISPLRDCSALLGQSED